MGLKNNWVGYVDRTYQQIKESVLTRFGVELPEMTDHTESNPFVKFLSIWSGISEHLNYYIDNAAREIFLPTARQYSSAVKTASLFNYRIRGVKAATVDLTFSLDAEILDDVVIPSGTKVRTEDGIVFTTLQQDTIYSGELSVVIPAVQMVIYTGELLGNSTGLKSQKFTLSEKTEDTSVKITVGGVAYAYKDTLAFSGPESEVFTTSLNTEGVLEVIFGNGVQGKVPTVGSSIIVEYGESEGALGNLAESTITEFVNPIAVSGANLSVTNYNRASGGADIQDLEDLKKVIPLSVRTLRRAVTEQDYEDIANMVSGVYGAKVVYTCGKTVDVYIVPEGGGIASQTLLNEVRAAYYDNTKMVTTQVRALAAGEIKLIANIDVFVLPSFSKITTEQKVREALKNYINVENGYISGSTELGNLYELIESIDGVDYSKIKLLSIIPFARITGGDRVLNWTREVKPQSNSTAIWTLRYSSAGDFELLKNGAYFGTHSLNDEINLPEIKFTILAGGYIAGDTWQFVTYPYNDSISLQEPSVLNLTDANLTLNMFGGV